MSLHRGITSRQALYDLFDQYAARKKEEASRHSFEPGSGLLKCYLLETSAHEQRGTVQIFRRADWELRQIDEGLFEARFSRRMLPHTLMCFHRVLLRSTQRAQQRLVMI
jgi:hypothetical protein